jgi:hypothetical protein
MSLFPARKFVVSLLAFAALAAMVGCQGFSSANPGSQNASQNSQSSSLTATPTSVSFGNTQLGTRQTLSDTLTNTSASDLTITQATASSAAFSTTGLNLPLTLSAGQSVTLSVIFSPQAAGAANGSLIFSNNGAGSPLAVALSGTGIAAGGLTLSSTSIAFGNVLIGASPSQTETVTNPSSESITISQAAISGAGFTYTGLSLPLTLAPNQSTSFAIQFSPTSAGTSDGTLSLTTAGAGTTVSVALSGTGSDVGASTGQLSVSPSTIAVGNVTVGTSGSRTGTLVASGASVVVSSAEIGSSEFSITGLSFPVTIAAGQSVSFTVTFTPQSSGLASTTVAFVSNASNSPANATLTGTGVAASAHSVDLSWNADSSPNVVGYNVYRRLGTSGSYAQINPGLISGTVYVDTTVTDGETYYYETTAVNSSGEESARSAAVQAIIPPP